MNRSTSSPSERRLAAAAMLAVLGLSSGCRGNCKEHVDSFAWALDAPGGAALHVVGSTDVEQEAVFASVTGTARNLGDAPCRVALYRHLAEPRREDLPALDPNVPAPLEIPAAGSLLFETLMPPARDGQAFVREIDSESDEASDGLPPEVPQGFDLSSDSDALTLDVWLTVATCDAPNLELDLRMLTERCWYLVRPHGSVSVEVLWPETRE